MSAGYEIFKLGMQVSPIILTKGIANGIPGGMLPIIAITEAANFVDGILSGDTTPNLDEFFAQYTQLAGTTLEKNEIATYPFANQTVAANAIISMPKEVALRMICPVQKKGGYFFKLAIMSALKKTLEAHNTAGGLYTIVTPSYIYTGCMMRSMADVSGGESKQLQYEWDLHFYQPLTSISAAENSKNSLMSILKNQTRQTGAPSWSNVGATLANPLTMATSSVVSAAKNLLGTVGG